MQNQTYILTFRPLPKQDVSGTFQLSCKASSLDEATRIGEAHVKEMNTDGKRYVRNRWGKLVYGIQWKLDKVELESNENGN
jgi:hypothetical protein